ncbi:MAG: radical SAM protein, partial [Clostridiales bacterium]|nr:radical SAM protein [Clostridiales bacterium]
MLFEKTGTAIWMSHLDTMRLMQRAFRRAGVVLHHSQGYT